jgi:hypothetical protein
MHKHTHPFTDSLFYFFVGCLPTAKDCCAKQPTNSVFGRCALERYLWTTITDSKYKGIINPANNRNVMARTMASQLRSTRLFNENYFALLAALDDIANVA